MVTPKIEKSQNLTVRLSSNSFSQSKNVVLIWFDTTNTGNYEFKATQCKIQNDILESFFREKIVKK